MRLFLSQGWETTNLDRRPFIEKGCGTKTTQATL